MSIHPNIICISRTDSIGDVLLTLPMCGLIKERYPNCQIIFLGKSYTKAVIDCCKYVDDFLDWDQIKALDSNAQIKKLSVYHIDTFIHVFQVKEIGSLAKKLNIKNRIANARSINSYINSTHRLNFTRRKSNLHEAQLNVKLLAPLAIELPETLSELWPYAGFSNAYEFPKDVNFDFSKNDVVILHPKSQGSAIEWGVQNFIKLSQKLAESNFTVVFCGTEKEGSLFRNEIPKHQNIHDLTGKLSLEEYIALIANSYALVAASTGPLHIASLLEIKALGIYSSRRPIHPGRWSPIGPNSKAIVHDLECENCKKGKNCNCIVNIPVQELFDEINGKN